MNEIEQLDFGKQYQKITTYLMSNNEPNIITILSYIIKKVCPLPSENKNKRKIFEEKILDNILNIFYTTNNKDIFSLCSSILSNFCTDFINFSINILNEEGIKKIYNELQNKYFNNPYIISNCINIYKQGLQHLIEQINTKDINDNYNNNLKDINYNTKRLLCNLVNWILYNKDLFFSIPQEGMQSLFKLIELLIETVSVPTQYEMTLDLNYSNNVHFGNLILYIFSVSFKDLDYDTLENYLLLLILLTKKEKYIVPLTQSYNDRNIFDVIKKLCGYIFLDNNSTKEDRENYPVLDSIFTNYCITILINMVKEAINHCDIMNLIYKLFMDYRGYVKTSEQVPLSIMEFLVKLSENLSKDKKIYDFILSAKNKIINNCIKFYVRNNNCYILVMQFLINIFEVSNFEQIENVSLNDVIKCFVDGLVNNERQVNNKSVYCLGKLIEINNKKNYNIDLILKFEENQVIEKLNTLILNKQTSISEDESAEELLKYIENKINFYAY